MISMWGMLGDTVMLHHLVHLGDSIAKLPHPPLDVRLVEYSLGVARAYITLARHDTAGTLTQFAALPDSVCHACGWSWLTQAELLSSQGRNAEAAAVLDETGILNSPLGTIAEFDRARVAERLGDKVRARDGYAFVAAMWRNGDPFFKRYADEARAGLKRLSEDKAGMTIPLNKP
jgi:hypothetical protein